MILENIKKRFSKGAAARDVATLTIGTAIAQGLTIIATPLLTRFYTPADFGLLAIFMTVVGVSATFVTGRYETSILVPEAEAEAANLVVLSLLLTCIGCMSLVAISFFLPTTILNLLGLGSLRNWLPLAFAAASATAVMTIIQNWLNRQKQYPKMAKLRILQSVLIAGLALLLGIFHKLGAGLLLAQVCASFFAAFIAIWLVRPVAALCQKENLINTAKIYQDAPKFLLPAALLDIITLQLPVILITAWFGQDMAGHFSMAWRILMLPMSFIGGAIGQVFFQKFSLTHKNPLAARKLLKSTWLILMALGFPPIVLIFFAGNELFSFVLGEKWAAAGSIAAGLAPMALAIFISSPTSGIYIVLGIQRFSPFFAFASLLYRPACLFYGFLSNNFLTGIKFWVVCEIMQIAAYQFLAWRKIQQTG